MRLSNVAIVLASLTALAGCSSTQPTTADLMRGHLGELQTQIDLKRELADAWESGDKLVASGEKTVRDSERRAKRAERDLKRAEQDLKRAEQELQQARQQIEEGNRQIAEGQRMISDSRQRFEESFPDRPLTH